MWQLGNLPVTSGGHSGWAGGGLRDLLWRPCSQAPLHGEQTHHTPREGPLCSVPERAEFS